MGFYIQAPEPKDGYLVSEYDAVRISHPPKRLDEVPEGMAVVCVLDNGPFKAAGYCFSDRELEAFSGNDGRRRTWLLMQKDLVEKLTGFKED